MAPQAPTDSQPTLVLLPGMDGTGRLFLRLTAELSSRLQTVVVSYPPGERLTYEQLRDQVASSLPTGDDFVLLGESFSGPIAIRLAADRPANLRGVVLAASFAASPLPRALRWLSAFAGLARVRPPKLALRAFLLGWDAPAELVDEVRETVAAVTPSVLAHRLRQVFAVDAREALRRIEVPVLYLAGRRDWLVGRRAIAQCEVLVRRFEASTIDAPHLLLQRRPREAAALIAAFVDRLAQRATAAR